MKIEMTISNWLIRALKTKAEKMPAKKAFREKCLMIV
jgi:hypothetical protein